MAVRRRGAGLLHLAVLVMLVGQTAISIVLWLDRVSGGFASWRDGLALAGLVWIAVFLVFVSVLMLRLLRVDAQLHDREEKFEIVAATSGEWLWQASPQLVVTYCSPAIAEVLGYQPAEIVGRSFFEFIDESDLSRAQAILSSAVARGGGWQDVELAWRRADGQRVLLQGSGLPLHDRQGRLVGFQGSRRTSSDGPHRQKLIEIRTRLDQLLSSDTLRIALQPIVDLESGRCVAVEALARFADGRSPDLWFAEAHIAGRGAELELLALEQALATLPQLPDETALSLNASPALISDARFGSLLTRQHALARLTIELTEHSIVGDYQRMQEALAPLRQRGLRLAVDDTGAGYASFSHVLQLRPDTIKLDRAWASTVADDRARRTLCSAAVQLAHDLNARVTAEGIETPAQLAAIHSAGVHHAQGYLFGRPDHDPQTWAGWASARWNLREHIRPRQQQPVRGTRKAPLRPAVSEA